MSEQFSLDAASVERLQKAMLNYQGRSLETTINSVLHNDGSELAQDAIQKLIPISGKTWKGKRPAARHAKSLISGFGNLFFVIKSNTNYSYLYFPDDGTNTRRHVGNQQFFRRGVESVQDEIVDRCITRLVNQFEEGVLDV